MLNRFLNFLLLKSVPDNICKNMYLHDFVSMSPNGIEFLLWNRDGDMVARFYNTVTREWRIIDTPQPIVHKEAIVSCPATKAR